MSIFYGPFFLPARGVDSSLETKMTCVGHYEIQTPIYKKIIKKK